MLVETLVPLGVLIYAAVGVAGWLTGGNYLEYNLLAHDPVHGQEWGVFLVEVGVFVTVAATMVAIFYAFAGRGGRDEGDARSAGGFLAHYNQSSPSS